MPAPSSQHNLAARMAIWSGRHRKKAIWGWLAFVLVVLRRRQRDGHHEHLRGRPVLG